ncbi:MAG: hypothetical protein RMM28_08915 [Thermoleophilia bacterium]|nr:hypothetical protein [Gaiellaceae bacterium]MDW8339245.1 hypothetical protein [Thermoleophilia bacterium]
MDARQALEELLQLSSQVRAAVLLAPGGELVAAAPEGTDRAEALARAARELTEAARELHEGVDVTRIEVELDEGALFVVREEGRAAAATTGPRPTAGLVVYDLRTCLDRIGEGERSRSGRQRGAASEAT